MFVITCSKFTRADTVTDFTRADIGTHVTYTCRHPQVIYTIGIVRVQWQCIILHDDEKFLSVALVTSMYRSAVTWSHVITHLSCFTSKRCLKYSRMGFTESLSRSMSAAFSAIITCRTTETWRHAQRHTQLYNVTHSVTHSVTHNFTTSHAASHTDRAYQPPSPLSPAEYQTSVTYSITHSVK